MKTAPDTSAPFIVTPDKSAPVNDAPTNDTFESSKYPERINAAALGNVATSDPFSKPPLCKFVIVAPVIFAPDKSHPYMVNPDKSAEIRFARTSLIFAPIIHPFPLPRAT